MKVRRELAGVGGAACLEQRVTKRSHWPAIVGARGHLTRSFARDPYPASIVAEHPSPSASLRLTTVGAATIRDRPCARDQCDAGGDAGGGEDQARVVDHRKPAVRKHAPEQLLEPGAGGRYLGARGARAACLRVRVAKPPQQRRQAIVDEAPLEGGDVGAWPFDVDRDVSVRAQPRAARGSADVEA